MSDLYLIQNRLREVKQQIDRYRLNIDALEKEAVELEMAARVIGRLTGASGDHAGAEDGSGSQDVGGGKPKGTPTMPEMIMSVLNDIGAPAKPKQVTSLIRSKWWPDADGAYVSAVIWRLWKAGRLMKDEGSSAYSLPEKFEAADDDPTRDTSAASDPNGQGREAVPGGGT